MYALPTVNDYLNSGLPFLIGPTGPYAIDADGKPLSGDPGADALLKQYPGYGGASIDPRTGLATGGGSGSGEGDAKLEEQRQKAEAALARLSGFYGTPEARALSSQLGGRSAGQDAPFSPDVVSNLFAQAADASAGMFGNESEMIRRAFSNAGIGGSGGELSAKLNARRKAGRQNQQARQQIESTAALENFGARERAQQAMANYLGQQGQHLQNATGQELGFRGRFQVLGDAGLGPGGAALSGLLGVPGFGAPFQSRTGGFGGVGGSQPFAWSGASGSRQIAPNRDDSYDTFMGQAPKTNPIEQQRQRYLAALGGGGYQQYQSPASQQFPSYQQYQSPVDQRYQSPASQQFQSPASQQFQDKAPYYLGGPAPGGAPYYLSNLPGSTQPSTPQAVSNVAFFNGGMQSNPNPYSGQKANSNPLNTFNTDNQGPFYTPRKR